MKVVQRLEKLEKRIFGREYLAVFVVDSAYDNPEKEQEARQKLVDEYVAAGNPVPTIRVFVNEIPL